MESRKQHLKEHNSGRIHTNGDKNKTLLSLSGHKEVDIQEDECKNGVI